MYFSVLCERELLTFLAEKRESPKHNSSRVEGGAHIHQGYNIQANKLGLRAVRKIRCY